VNTAVLKTAIGDSNGDAIRAQLRQAADRDRTVAATGGSAAWTMCIADLLGSAPVRRYPGD
jgi:hypothetical protein